VSPAEETLSAFARRVGVVSLQSEASTKPDEPLPIATHAEESVPSACDVCGAQQNVRPVIAGMLRPTAAPWITAVCPACQRRLGR
jgi:hypothetical protein